MERSPLHAMLERHLGPGLIPGAVALVDHAGDRETVAFGQVDTEGTAPMSIDSIFRIASVTKPITVAVAMMLVDDGTLGLQDHVERWLPELADRQVVRTPRSPLDDVVPARRPITVFDLLAFQCGYGFAADFSLPALAPLFADLGQGPPEPQKPGPPDAWMATLSGVPLLYQPGEAWLYNTGADILGVLIARATGQDLPDVFAERLLEPLGMADTGFWVPPRSLGRMTSYYRQADGGGLELVDPPEGQWASPPAFPSGAGVSSRSSMTCSPSPVSCTTAAWPAPAGCSPRSRSGR